MEQQDCGTKVPEQTRETRLYSDQIRCYRFRFPDRQQIFPALVTREFRWQAIEFSSESRGGLGYLKPEIGKFPCIFPWNREPTGGDRFADDCFLRQQLSY